MVDTHGRKMLLGRQDMKKPPHWEKWIEDEGLCKRWFDDYVRREIIRKDRFGKRVYMRKAEHNINFANWLKEKHRDEIPKIFGDERFYDWVIVSYYYAVYHGALALLSENGFSSKNHYATICAVILLYYHGDRKMEKEDMKILGRCIEKEDGEIMASGKALREKASYNASATFELRLVENMMDDILKFIDKVRDILGK